MKIFINQIRGSKKTHGEDVCTYVIVDSSYIFMIGDGHSSKKNSADFANSWINFMKSSFHDRKIHLLSIERTKIDLKDLLAAFQKQHRIAYPAAMSFLILIITEQWAGIFFVGDCRIGFLENNLINWLNPVDRLVYCFQNFSDSEKENHPEKNKLTRSFKAKRFEWDSISYQNIKIESQNLILATDGFWSDLDLHQQISLISSGTINPIDDDISYICINFE